MYLSILIFGFVGGALRGIVGFIKYQFAYKSVKFKPWYYLLLTGLSGLVGLLVAWTVLELKILARFPNSLAVVVGYAGGDLLENLYKIILGKASIYSLPEDLQIK
jgi:hypothetical protein